MNLYKAERYAEHYRRDAERRAEKYRLVQAARRTHRFQQRNQRRLGIVALVLWITRR